MHFEFADRRQRLLVGWIAGVVLLVAVVCIFRQFHFFMRSPPQHLTWYYDLNTGQLFADTPNQITPVRAPSAPVPIPAGMNPDDLLDGVLAYVYACKSCEESGRVIAYLETYTAEAHNKLQEFARFSPGVELPPELQALKKGEQGVLVKRPKDDQWVDRNSAAGQKIVREALREACPSNPTAPRCFPR